MDFLKKDKTMFSISQPFSHIVAKFILDGKDYQIENFKINFHQPSDFKGQPEHEVKGGQLHITIPQLADNNLYLWAKKSTLVKSGEVVFQTDLGISVLKINFANAYCINLTREVNSRTGGKTSLVISPETLSINGVTHENVW